MIYFLRTISHQPLLQPSTANNNKRLPQPSDEEARIRYVTIMIGASHLRDGTVIGPEHVLAIPLSPVHQGEGPPVVGEEQADGDRTVPCLGHYMTAWKDITSQPFVLQAVTGYRLDFVSIPPLLTLGPGRALTGSTRPSLTNATMGEEVEALLGKGAIERVHKNTLGFYSFPFLVPKKEGGKRPVINLKPLNEYIRKKPFHMTTLKEVGQAIRHGDWSIIIDLQDAFLHVPVHKEYRRFLRFTHLEKVYQFRRLPLGLTSSPQVFTDITRPLVEHCRVKGIRVIFYLDDILVPKNEGGAETCYQTETTERIYQEETISYDYTQRSGSGYSPWRFH